jgi:hypothetical protein
MEKLPYYSQRQTTIGKISNLLGSPLRVAIIEQYSKNGDCFEDDFITKHQISINILKKNIRALNKGGLLIRHSAGRNKAIIYKINWPKILEYKSMYDQMYMDFNYNQILQSKKSEPQI